MLRNRIVASSAIFMLFSGLTAGGAAAQTAANQTPGSPLQLLQMLKRAVHPHQEAAASSSARPHRNAIAGRAAHSHVAAARRHQSPTEIASATPAAETSPVENAEPQIGAFVTEPPSPPTAAAAELNEVVIAGQTVKIAAPDDVNEIDLATSGQDSQTAATAEGAATPPAMTSVSSRGAKSDSLTVASAQQSAASPQQPVSAVGSAGWIAQVLAALGGAVAAGSAAWFLMGATPQRTYG
jgi:hypothetical protein